MMKFELTLNILGKIPASMVNKVNEKQPLYAGVIRDKMEERCMFQDPPHEGDVKINAAKMHPSLREKREMKPKPNGNIVNTVTKIEQKNDMVRLRSFVYNATKTDFVRQELQLLLLTPKFKGIGDCRQKKFPQAEIQNKRRRKLSLKPS